MTKVQETADRKVRLVCERQFSSWNHVGALLGLSVSTIRRWFEDDLHDDRTELPSVLERVHIVVAHLRKGRHFTDKQFARQFDQAELERRTGGTRTGLDDPKERKAIYEADRAELELGKMKRELIDVASVEELIGGPVAEVSKRLDTLLPRIQAVMPSMPASVSDQIEAEVASFKNELSQIRMEHLKNGTED